MLEKKWIPFFTEMPTIFQELLLMDKILHTLHDEKICRAVSIPGDYSADFSPCAGEAAALGSVIPKCCNN